MMVIIAISLIITSVIDNISSYEQQAITINKLRTNQPWARFSSDYLRCFCNLPQCILTGYMCKSAIGGCFSNLLIQQDGSASSHPSDYRGRHGCLEFLDKTENHTEWCTHRWTDNKSMNFCCYHDMCNHVDSPQIKNLINNTKDRGGKIQEKLIITTNSGYNDPEVWFKAATIAVPICGAIIVFVLIAIAVKILTSENQTSTINKLGSIYIDPKAQQDFDIVRKSPTTPPYIQQNCLYDQELQRIQMPLLKQTTFDNKNETNAKLNLIHSSDNDDYLNPKSIILEIGKDAMCSDINLMIDNNNHFDDKTSKK